MRGKKHTEETKKKMSENNGIKGKPRSEEVKNKISIANKGKIRTEEQRKNISEAHKGQIISKETIEKSIKTRKENGTFRNREEAVENYRKVAFIREAKKK